MKLEDVDVLFGDDNKMTSFNCVFRDEYDTDVHIHLEPDTKTIYLWDQLEEHIKAKLAEKLGIEEPLYKEHPGIQYSEGINASVWSEPDITEMVEGVDYDEDYVDRDLIPESNRDNS